MNKFLIFIILVSIAILPLSVNAQNPPNPQHGINYTPREFETIYFTSCTELEPLSDEEALVYVQTYAHYTSIGECDDNYTAHCTLVKDERHSDDCHFEYTRYFRIRNACGDEVVIPQTVWVDRADPIDNTPLPAYYIQGMDFETLFPNNTTSIMNHLSRYDISIPPCWHGHCNASYIVNDIVLGPCERNYHVVFSITNPECPNVLLRKEQTIQLYYRNPPQLSEDNLYPIDWESCGNEWLNLPREIKDIEDFAAYGATFSHYMNKEDFIIDCFDTYVPAVDECDVGKYSRRYEVHHRCSNTDFVLYQNIFLHKNLSYIGQLNDSIYEVDRIPTPFRTLNELRTWGVNIKYTCDESDLEISSTDDYFPDIPNYIVRHYTVCSKTCSDLTVSFDQILKKYAINPIAFALGRIVNASLEGMADGSAQLVEPVFSRVCPSCAAPRQIFQVVWANETLGKYYVSDPNNPDCNIFYIDSLECGNYTVSVYPICPDYHWNQTQPIFTDHFTIYASKLEMNIVPWISYNNGDLYQEFFSDVAFMSSDGGYISLAEENAILENFSDRWIHVKDDGLLLSKLKREFDLWDILNVVMEGHGMYERFQSDFDYYNNLDWGNYTSMHSDLQRLVIGKNIHKELTYQLLKNYGVRGNDDGVVYKEVTKNLYYEELWCSKDPNELFGPVGYTDADSICVQMINPNDDLNYTIMYENDPAFATAAAARVKIICPLSDKMDPTTFRLGNFGFNNMTFEVPELATYYNQRLQLDSLGYCLDVTASLQANDNYAYWIFQTIDPETGVAPIDSLGFLPVNDTLTGCGEGFVTFSVGVGNNPHTRDSIAEKADIYFDDNAVVPTNTYVNHLDCVAPTSKLCCDSTGAYQYQKLTFTFEAVDDEGGSGVKHVELYVNKDQQKYELVAKVSPDSTFVYALKDASRFEFVSIAVDNVGNIEPFKTLPEFVYGFGNPPTDITLSNNSFNENDASGTVVGFFTTYDDQNSNIFDYALVSGEGSDNNQLFRIEGDKLVTSSDFRCRGMFNYSIRVRTTDLTSCFYEKTFSLYVNQTEYSEPVTIYQYLCPGDDISFGTQTITEAGLYYDTLSNLYGCDSIVCLEVHMNPAPDTLDVVDGICYGYDYTDNGFTLSAEDIASLTQGWDMASDMVLDLDNSTENAFGCNDFTRLQLTVHPSFDFVTDALVCPTDLPYRWRYYPYYNDTTVVFNYTTADGCDSTYTLHLTLNRDTATQSDFMPVGWTWYSSYIDQSNGKGLATLEEALGNYGSTIKSQTQMVQNLVNTTEWAGSLQRLDNCNSFRIQVYDTLTVNVFGCVVNPLDCPDTLQYGWNWTGFPVRSSMDINSISACLNPHPIDGDILKSQNALSTYSSTTGTWFGTLLTLNPGIGYMYKSNNRNPAIMTYPEVTRAAGTPMQLPDIHWIADSHQYAQNITFIGLANLDGQPIESDTLEIGAFCRGEERGSGRAIYLDALDIYRVFLTVQGEEDDTIVFRLYDHNRDKERRIRSHQQVVFHADEHYGSLNNPYPFNFNTDYDKLIKAEICEGEYYVNEGFREYQAGTYFQERSNDSIIRLDLSVNPVYHIEKDVVAFEFPMNYEGITFNEPGQYTLPFETAAMCDSVLVVNVKAYDGERALLVSPVPADRSQRVTLFFPFTSKEQDGLTVEVYTMTGNLVQSIKPTRFPIELQPFTSSGTYMVTITMGTGEIVTGKIIVR